MLALTRWNTRRRYAGRHPLKLTRRPRPAVQRRKRRRRRDWGNR